MLEENLFENILASLRTRRGWTQEDAAAHIGKGISRHTYSDLETGKLPPSPKHLKLIAAGFKLNQADTDALYRAAHHESPKLHNLPFDRNLLFTGRESLLEQLSQLLKENYSVALTGLAGIGKTQIALEYAHRCYVGKVYQAVFWVSAADEASLKIGYATLAEKLDLPEQDEQELDKIVQAVKDWLEWHTNWLLIMDNADNLQLARSFFPKSHNGHILLTTRTQMVGNVARKIDIGRMEPSEGLLFLLLRSDVLKAKTVLEAKTKLDTFAADLRNAASQVVELLDGHSLALDQAGAYINDGASLTEYINLYNEKRGELLSERGSLDEENEGKYSEYPDTVAVTFALCFEKASKRHPLSIDILRFCAFLHPDAIPDELFQHDDSFKRDTTGFKKGRTALLRYSLIRRNTEEQTCSMHRLVQAVLIDDMSPDLHIQWRVRVLRALDAASPDKVDFKDWRRYGRLLPHALICANWTEDELTLSDEAVMIFHKTGKYLRVRGQYAEAETLLGRVLSIYKQYLGVEHHNTATALIDLATLYTEHNKFSQAELLYQQALVIMDGLYGNEHPSTAGCMNNLAIVYYAQGKYELAEPLHQQVLAFREKYFGVEHLETAGSLLNLANLYAMQGKYKQSAPLLGRAFSIMVKQLGEDHPDIARCLSMVAIHYYVQGEYEKGVLWYRRALKINEKNLGEDHPDIARSLLGLAYLLEALGQDEELDALFQRALSIREQRLGATHPLTQEARKDYMAFLQRIRRDVQAVAPEANDEP
jgi:tetratricopeptide (TPR) repeat protein